MMYTMKRVYYGLKVVWESDDREGVSVDFCFHCFHCHRVAYDQRIEAETKWPPFSQTTFSNAFY